MSAVCLNRHADLPYIRQYEERHRLSHRHVVNTMPFRPPVQGVEYHLNPLVMWPFPHSIPLQF